MNAYTSISGGGFQAPSPSYDANGNTLSLPRPDGSSQALTWDTHNRLRSVNATSTQMTYDPRGRLVWVRINDGLNPATDEIWSWSSWTLLAREVVQGGTPLETFRYTWGPDLSGTLEGAGGVGGLLAIEHAAGSSTTWDIRHVHYDANGNVLALTDDAGQISARYRYSPFGELVVSQNTDNSGWNERNIHRFSTKPEAAGTGLLYYGYRWYDPATGRWPSRDPIEEEGGLNVYGFVWNDPIDDFDVLGERGGRTCRGPNCNRKTSSVEPQGISFVFSQSLSATGCFPTATPGVVFCVSGGWNVTTGTCRNKSGETKKYFTIEGSVNFFARFGGRPGGAWTYRQPIVKNERCCPEIGGDFGGGMFIRAELGPLSAGCSLTVSIKSPEPKINCYGGLRAGFAARMQVDVGGQVGGKHTTIL